MYAGRMAFLVHFARIPFIEIGRHGVDPPVDEQAEFCLCIPLRDAIAGEAFPINFEGALFDHFVDGLQICLHFY